MPGKIEILEGCINFGGVYKSYIGGHLKPVLLGKSLFGRLRLLEKGQGWVERRGEYGQNKIKRTREGKKIEKL